MECTFLSSFVKFCNKYLTHVSKALEYYLILMLFSTSITLFGSIGMVLSLIIVNIYEDNFTSDNKRLKISHMYVFILIFIFTSRCF